MPLWLEAGFWGTVAGSALVVGAAIGYLVRLPTRVVAGIMAFGAGVLVSVLSFDLMDEAYRRGGFGAAAAGFLLGAAVYTVVNLVLSRRGAKHRKRSGAIRSDESGQDNGTALAAGALLDGIPESIVIGLSLLAGAGVSAVAVAGIFVSNIPEGLSSAAGMRAAGRSLRWVLALWVAIALASGAASIVGVVVFGGLSEDLIAGTTAVAAGAVLAMIADTMLPEAFEATHDMTGLITVAGFLAAFILSKLG
jgi:zinc transporter, ZIP family